VCKSVRAKYQIGNGENEKYFIFIPFN